MGNKISSEVLLNFDFIPSYRSPEYIYENISSCRDPINLDSSLSRDLINPDCSSIWAFMTLLSSAFPSTKLPSSIDMRDTILRSKYSPHSLEKQTIRYLTLLDCLENLDKFDITDGTITQYYTITPDSIIGELKAGHLIATGIPVYSNFFKEPVVNDTKKGDKMMGVVHAIIYAYCPIKDAFHVHLPFGPSYFDNGDVWIGREYSHKTLQECWVLESIKINKGGAAGKKQFVVPTSNGDRITSVAKIQRQYGAIV
jgi:hypothetical protein